LKVDANQQSKLASDLRVDTYPTLVFASPEGKILGSQVGFIEAAPLQEMLQRAFAVTGGAHAPDALARDFEDASKAAAHADFARAVALLRNVVEDGKDRSVQQQAKRLLQDIEDQAAGRCARAKELVEGGKVAEAVEMVAETLHQFAGTRAAQEGSHLLV